jgi:uncharacterized membrane protein YphA (DoxX/SURF4 family)
MKLKVYHIVSILFALLFINAGLNKFFNYLPVPPDMPEALVNDNKAFMEIVWLMPLVAVVEVVGGILIIMPKYRAIGALVVLPIMIGIVLLHATVAVSGLPLAIGLLLVLSWMIWENRQKYFNLIKHD